MCAEHLHSARLLFLGEESTHHVVKYRLLLFRQPAVEVFRVQSAPSPKPDQPTLNASSLPSPSRLDFPAGVATIAPILEATVEDWDWTMNVRGAERRSDDTKEPSRGKANLTRFELN